MTGCEGDMSIPQVMDEYVCLIGLSFITAFDKIWLSYAIILSGSSLDFTVAPKYQFQDFVVKLD